VTIREIIAAIDAEIATLQQARLLVAQSLVHVQINSGTRATSRTVVPSKPRHEPLAPARHVPRNHGPKNHGLRDLEIPEVPVAITRIPAKSAPAQRGFKAISKERTALNAEIPAGPVAVPKKKGEEITAFEGHPADGASVSASAFGQAVTRGLMALDSKPAWPVIPTPQKATTQY
jgi:hypothetical protein